MLEPAEFPMTLSAPFPFVWQNNPEVEVTKPMSPAGGPAPGNSTPGVSTTGTPAGADAPASPFSGPFSMLAMILLIFGVMYLLVIRPEKKKQKELEKLRGEMKKGDTILLSSGMIGVLSHVVDDYVVVEIADKVRARFQKQSVVQVLDLKGADKEKLDAASAK